MTEALAIEILRKNWQRLMEADGVTSCGVGYRFKDGKRTDEVCIQCTVEKKYSLEALEAREMTPLPEQVQDNEGNQVEVDVIERNYKLSFEVEPTVALEEDVDYHKLRRSRLDPLLPGASVSHADGTAGTIGAIVFDKESGQPLILSNWHVLQGARGELGDDIVQPGPFDDSEVHDNFCGQLLRSHLGLAGDCAVATIDGREWAEEILELDVAPARMARPNLDDAVVKSGRTTGVTYGIVERVNVVANLNYGGDVGVQTIGGFEIRPNPDKPPANGEISMGGDSGSVWMIDAEGKEDADVVVGLHFAGEADPDPDAEHALACMITSTAEKLRISFTPPEEAIDTEADLWREVFARLDALETTVVNTMPQEGCVCKASPADAEDLLAAPEASIPVHGNWCGPGHGGGPPKDALDQACMHHDKCYDDKGYFNCECDGDLVSRIDRALLEGRIPPRLKPKALLIRQYFANSPCARYVTIGGRQIPLPVSNHPAAAVRSAARNLNRGVRSGARRIRRRLGF